MSAIDIHTHAFPDDLADRAVSKLQDNAQWQAVGRGTVADLIESMDAAGVDVSVVCTIATKIDQVKSIYKWCKNLRSARVEPLASVHPATPKAARWIRRIAEAGLVGIKLHPMYQEFAFDDPKMDEVYAATAECGLIIAVHSGRDIAFPDDDDRAAPRRIRRVVDRFPNLKLICTHLGGWRDWDEAEKHLVGTNVYLETSFSVDLLGSERAAQLIRRHGTQRVLFGTDWPWNGQQEGIRQIQSLGLTDGEVRAILFGNAAELLGY